MAGYINVLKLAIDHEQIFTKIHEQVLSLNECKNARRTGV
jgi:hypothetical protein